MGFTHFQTPGAPHVGARLDLCQNQTRGAGLGGFLGPDRPLTRKRCALGCTEPVCKAKAKEKQKQKPIPKPNPKTSPENQSQHQSQSKN